MARLAASSVLSRRRLAPVGRCLLLLGVVAVATAVWWVRSPHAVAPAAASAPRPEPDIRAAYLRDCGVCHGAEGRGTSRGLSLIGVGEAKVDYYVSTGRMPLYGGYGRKPESPDQQPAPGELQTDSQAQVRRHPPLYPPDVISRLDSYVASLSSPSEQGPAIPVVDIPAGDLAHGGELFRAQCAACHAWGGDGGALLHVNAPSLHRATGVQVAEAVRTGPGEMPAFGEAALSGHDLDSVAAYVRYLDKPRDPGGQPLWHVGPVAEGAVAWLVGMVILLAVCRWIGDRS